MAKSSNKVRPLQQAAGVSARPLLTIIVLLLCYFSSPDSHLVVLQLQMSCTFFSEKDWLASSVEMIIILILCDDDDYADDDDY